MLSTGEAAWQPVFADVVRDGEKIGHVVSDGYENARWSFYPRNERRRSVHDKHIDDVLPAWTRGATFGEFQTYRERHLARDAGKGNL